MESDEKKETDWRSRQQGLLAGATAVGPRQEISSSSSGCSSSPLPLRETGLIGDTHEVNTTVTGDMAAMVEDLPQVNRLGNAARAKPFSLSFPTIFAATAVAWLPPIDDFPGGEPAHPGSCHRSSPARPDSRLVRRAMPLPPDFRARGPPYYRALMYAAVPVDDAGLAGLGEALGLDSGRLTADAGITDHRGRSCRQPRTRITARHRGCADHCHWGPDDCRFCRLHPVSRTWSPCMRNGDDPTDTLQERT